MLVHNSIPIQTKIIITTGASSSIIEGIISGCSVLMPATDNSAKYNLEYLKIPKENFKLYNDVNELDRKLNYFLNEKERFINKRIKKINFLKKNLFENITKRNLNIFT